MQAKRVDLLLLFLVITISIVEGGLAPASAVRLTRLHAAEHILKGLGVELHKARCKEGLGVPGNPRCVQFLVLRRQWEKGS